MAKRKDVSVKMDEGVVEECRLAAVLKGMSLAEYLSDSMRVVAQRDIEEGFARRAQGAPEKPAPKKKGGRG